MRNTENTNAETAAQKLNAERPDDYYNDVIFDLVDEAWCDTNDTRADTLFRMSDGSWLTYDEPSKTWKAQ